MWKTALEDNSHRDMQPKGQTTEHSKSWKANTPNCQKYCTSDLVLHYLSQILVCRKVLNQTTTISISGIATTNQRCVPQYDV